MINELPLWYRPDGRKRPAQIADRARRLRPGRHWRVAVDDAGWGLTVPLTGRAAARRTPSWSGRCPGSGYTDVWSAETSGTDAFTPLALASAWEPTLRLGTAIVPVFTRGPALIAMSAAALAAAAPGRFVLGLGASSPVIVGNWNGIAFDEPYRRPATCCASCARRWPASGSTASSTPFTIKRFKLEQAPADAAADHARRAAPADAARWPDARPTARS